MINPLSATQAVGDLNGAKEGSFCTTCGYQNPIETDVCLNCAAALGQQCPVCEQAVPAGSKFCVECGAQLSDNQMVEGAAEQRIEILQNLQALMPTALAQKISAASGEIFGEQREVTILDISLINVTGTDEVDDEDLYFLQDEALRLLVEVVYKYEGTVDKFTGSGLMALFGAPIAHENDPERAIRAALEMQNIMRDWQVRVREEAGLDFQMFMGLNTGQVIAGKVGNDLHMDYTVIGETGQSGRSPENHGAAGYDFSHPEYLATHPISFRI